MCVDIRKYTRVVIRKNREYLQCKSELHGALVWSTSPWDAWWTRNAETARDIAKKTGGIAMLFNPITGKTKVL
jgi:hypothetical protein